MHDLISRQDAIEEIARWIGYIDEDMILRIQTGLKKLPSAQPERKKGRWIPAWQELPQDNRFVLVCNDDARIAVAQYIGHEIDSYHPWQIAYCPYDVDIWEDSEYGKIMAWMELPKPYREGEKDDKEGSTDVFERLRKRILR